MIIFGMVFINDILEIYSEKYSKGKLVYDLYDNPIQTLIDAGTNKIVECVLEALARRGIALTVQVIEWANKFASRLVDLDLGLNPLAYEGEYPEIRHGILTDTIYYDVRFNLTIKEVIHYKNNNKIIENYREEFVNWQ